MPETTSAELVRGAPAREVLKAASTLAELAQAFADVGSALVDIAEFGDGFTLLDNKDRLLDVPFVITGSRVVDEGKFGRFVALHCVTLTDDGQITGRWIITDGGTGIASQWAEEIAPNLAEGAIVMVRTGLRKSDYTYVDDKGESKPATTYYLSI